MDPLRPLGLTLLVSCTLIACGDSSSDDDPDGGGSDQGASDQGGVCGHYTQVVWAESLRLGCGVADCASGSPFGGGQWQNWVCNYDPRGNWAGEKPY